MGRQRQARVIQPQGLSMAAGKRKIRVRLAGHSRLGQVSRLLLKVGGYDRLQSSRLCLSPANQKLSVLMTSGKIIQQLV